MQHPLKPNPHLPPPTHNTEFDEDGFEKFDLTQLVDVVPSSSSSSNNSTTTQTNNEWMKVKTKRRSSVSSQRFDQPNVTASLPTLFANLNKPVSASKPTGSKPKIIVSTVPSGKKPTPSAKATSNVASKRVNVNNKPKKQSVSPVQSRPRQSELHETSSPWRNANFRQGFERQDHHLGG